MVTKTERNVAVDFYRVIAMVAVALGHWMAISVGISDGKVQAGNALEVAPDLSWMTWFLQVMPLFFFAGGFSSAVSLDSHNIKGGNPQDWIAARLRRMLSPTMYLAYFWAAACIVGILVGQSEIIFLGAAAAAIPLWFLANYTIDTAIAPFTLPMYRKNPVLFFSAIAGAFSIFEIAGWLGIPYIHGVNWVIGWLVFQLAGFAWRDGKMPSIRVLAVLTPALWGLTYAAVKIGPWRVSMVNDGIPEFNPTHPPSLALMLFGFAYCSTALLLAPLVNNYLKRSAKAAKGVMVLGAVSMSVYLWHFTAAVVAGIILLQLDALPTAEVGTVAWWFQKLPLIGMSFVSLLVILKFVKKREVDSLLAPKVPFNGGIIKMLLVAAIMSTSIKLWGSKDPVLLMSGIILSIITWKVALTANTLPSPRPVVKRLVSTW